MKVIQWPKRWFPALAEDSGSGLSTHVIAHNHHCLYLCGRVPDALFWPLRAPPSTWCTYIHSAHTTKLTNKIFSKST